MCFPIFYMLIPFFNKMLLISFPTSFMKRYIAKKNLKFVEESEKKRNEKKKLM